MQQFIFCMRASKSYQNMVWLWV